jgi:glutamine amidotransferase
MQILFERSEEGEGEGIGIIPGVVRRLRARVIPQMGWNDVVLETAPRTLREPRDAAAHPGPSRPEASHHPLFRGLSDLVAYYANSYVCTPRDPSVTLATTEYQGDVFPAAVHLGRTWGVQFHPEKSSAAGLALLRNFLQELTP